LGAHCTNTFNGSGNFNFTNVISPSVPQRFFCFHCLRVSYVNRLRRAGVPREVAMRLVNHASELIHKIYQREKVEDVAQWRDIVQFEA
jgi:hypothetical protein